MIGSNGSAVVSWTPPAPDSGGGIVEYLVTGGSSTCSTSTELTCELTGLPANGIDVEVTVVASNDDGPGQPATVVVVGVRLSMTRSAFILLPGKSLTTSGLLLTSDGTPMAGRTVRIEQRPLGGTEWTTTAQVSTSETGSYAASNVPTSGIDVRVRFTGGIGVMGGSPYAGRVQLRQTLTLGLSRYSANLGTNVSFQGVLGPARPGVTVSLQVWRSGRWTTTQTARTSATSTYGFNPVVMYGGNTQWRTYAAPTSTRAYATSPVRVLRMIVTLNAVTSSITRASVKYSWRPGCPVSYVNLRAVRMNHLGMDGTYRRGTLIVHKNRVNDVTAAFSAALTAKFRIKSIAPIEAYYAGGKRTGIQADVASMTADNTSAFNCRRVVGHPERRSAHSWGDTIDINPRENPYVTGGRVYPSGSKTYLNRSRLRPGMLTSGRAPIKQLRARGWTWYGNGGRMDYQHISRSGG